VGESAQVDCSCKILFITGVTNFPTALMKQENDSSLTDKFFFFSFFFLFFFFDLKGFNDVL